MHSHSWKDTWNYKKRGGFCCCCCFSDLDSFCVSRNKTFSYMIWKWKALHLINTSLCHWRISLMRIAYKPPLGSIWVKKYDINSGSECSFWGDMLQVSVNLELTWNMKEDKNYFHLKWHSFSNNMKENAYIVSPEIMYTTAIQMWSSWEGNWDLFAASGTQLIGWEDEHTEILAVILAAGTLLPLLKKLHFFLSSGSWRLTALWSPSPQMGQRINIR